MTSKTHKKRLIAKSNNKSGKNIRRNDDTNTKTQKKYNQEKN